MGSDKGAFTEVKDVVEESVGVKKEVPARRIGAKISCSAEVHNLSERDLFMQRRRDSINEKMRALQELIPNRNKIMSMGTGLYMPAMILPPGIQHVHAPQMGPFCPIGVGMQMRLGVGCGMGMLDANDESCRFTMVHVPQMQGTKLATAHAPGSTALHGMTNGQVFGLLIFSFPGESFMKPSILGLNSCGTTLMENVGSVSACNLKDTMPHVNSQDAQNSKGCNSTNQMSTQFCLLTNLVSLCNISWLALRFGIVMMCEATTGGFEHSTLVRNSGHATSTNYRGATNPHERG
ncbi:hypothetical protein VNO80_04597 [Phaseolus coccineus]|uniref:BHLH domain-containing protein n=1 Tax=Phaseolus coccineus TaxID=3886 RepID=A0AAN9RNV0_PHACN